MLIIGLTGSIGMGKSTVGKRFVERGVEVIDADLLVHELYRGEAVGPIEAAFPGTVVDGEVDRVKLSAVLLKAPEMFKTLEAIVHPLVKAAEVRFLKAAAVGGAECAALDSPLLFEMHGDARVDVTVVVSAPLEIQRKRVLERPGMTTEKFEQIVSRQLPDEEKRRRADFVVNTGQELAQTLVEVDAIIDALMIRKGTAYQNYWL